MDIFRTGRTGVLVAIISPTVSRLTASPVQQDRIIILGVKSIPSGLRPLGNYFQPSRLYILYCQWLTYTCITHRHIQSFHTWSVLLKTCQIPSDGDWGHLHQYIPLQKKGGHGSGSNNGDWEKIGICPVARVYNICNVIIILLPVEIESFVHWINIQCPLQGRFFLCFSRHILASMPCVLLGTPM